MLDKINGEMELVFGNENWLLIFSRNLNKNMIIHIYKSLEKFEGNTLNLIVYTKGGDVNTARMIAKIIHDKFDNINVYVPYMCTSSGTILSLCAHKLYCSPISIFSPIDPHLNGVAGEAEFSISASDIKRVSSLLKDWYCITEQENLIEVLSQDISLASMSSLYTSYEEVRFIAKELISLGGGVDIDKADVIIDKLITNCYSHEYCLTSEEMASYGIKVNKKFDGMEALINVVLDYINYSEEKCYEVIYESVISTRFSTKVQFINVDSNTSSWGNLANV